MKSTSELVTTEVLLDLIGNSSLPVGSLITQNIAHMAPAYTHVRIMEETRCQTNWSHIIMTLQQLQIFDFCYHKYMPN